MKKQILPILALVSLVITGCTTKKNNSSSGADNPSVSSVETSNNESSTESYNPLVETYPITYTESTGAEIVLSKKRAQPGETVTFTVTPKTNYTINSVVASNTTVKNNGGNNYSFVMPERAVRITVSVTVAGDFVIVGDFTAKLEKVEGKDLYVAKDVKVPTGSDFAYFSYSIKNSSGQQEVIDSLLLDETRCFADVTFSSTPSKGELMIATGCTYDFYYDPANAYPMYIVRKSVDVLPSTGELLYKKVFDGMMRSFSTEHPTDLKEIKYTYNTDDLKYSYNLKAYEGNESLATINDFTDENNVQKYYVYKHADLENGIYEVVNTWPKNLGNNEDEDALWQLDPYGEDEKATHQPFSARLDIVNDINPNQRNVVDLSRHEIETRDALLFPYMGAHYGQELEYEFYDAYRHVYSGNIAINAPSYSNPGYSIVANADGSFRVNIDAVVEYNHEAGSGTSDAEMHEGHTNKMVMDFAKNGALVKLDWTRGDYSKNQWNFTTHKPASENVGKIKKVTVENTYGSYYTGSPSFNKTQYFINAITKASWFNKDNTAGKSAEVSNVMFGDVLEFYAYGEGKKTTAITDEFVFEPATALDAWQYGVIATKDPTMVGLNGQNRYEVLNIGQATVTVGYRGKNANGPMKDIKISADGGKYALGFYQDARVPGYDSYGSAVSTTIEAKAGYTSTYYIDVSYADYMHKAPCSYRLAFRSDEKNEFGDYTYSGTTPYFNVISTGHELKIDCNTEASLKLEKTKTVYARVLSDYYVPGRSITEFIFNIHPKLSNDGVVGTKWQSQYVDTQGHIMEDCYTDLYFYNKRVEGKSTLTYTGKFVDFYADDKTSAMDIWEFEYTVNNMGDIIDAKITKVDFESTELIGCRASDFYLVFDGIDEDSGCLKVCLWYETSEELGYIFGEGQLDDYNQPEISAWCGFSKVS